MTAREGPVFQVRIRPATAADVDFLATLLPDDDVERAGSLGYERLNDR
jgi:hypothetical protein